MYIRNSFLYKNLLLIKMLKSLVLVLLTAQICLADFLSWGNLTRDDFAEARIVGSNAVLATDLTALNYLVYISDKTAATAVAGQLGEGVVVNKYWIVTLRSVLDTTMTATNIKLTFDALDPIAASATTTRMGKEIRTNTAACTANSLVNCISVCRFCPSLTGHDATFATTLTPYSAGTDMHLYTYKDSPALARVGETRALHVAVKKVGETCECSDNTQYSSTCHMCLAENTAVYTGDVAANFDLKGTVVTSSDKTKVIGFITKGQGSTTNSPGEFVTYIKCDSTDTWLATNTPI